MQQILGQIEDRATETQKKVIQELKKFIITTVKKVESIRKKTNDSNQDYCYVFTGLIIQHFAESAINSFFLILHNPTLSKKFITMFSKLSLFTMKKPFEKLEKDKTKIAKMNEEEVDEYIKKLVAPLETYLTKKSLQLSHSQD
jgi:predicted site-specific integrase-resolvase